MVLVEPAAIPAVAFHVAVEHRGTVVTTVYRIELDFKY